MRWLRGVALFDHKRGPRPSPEAQAGLDESIERLAISRAKDAIAGEVLDETRRHQDGNGFVEMMHELMTRRSVQ